MFPQNYLEGEKQIFTQNKPYHTLTWSYTGGHKYLYTVPHTETKNIAVQTENEVPFIQK